MELIRHSFTYLLARGIPGIISITSIAVFTRMLNLEEYGAFVLVIAGADFLDAVLLQWIYWSLVRYLEKNRKTPEVFFSTILMAFTLALIPAVIFTIISVFVIKEYSLILASSGFLYFVMNGWFEINLHRSRAELVPVKFGILDLLRSILSFAFAVLFILLNFGAAGILIGFTLGRWIPPLFVNRGVWKGVFPWKYDKLLFRKLLYFGLPLGVSVALAMVVNLSDRILIGFMLGSDSAALYGAGYDIVYRILLTAMNVLNLAGYPLIVKALETGGKVEADKVLSNYFTILLGISIAGFATFFVLRVELAQVLLGEEYRSAGILLMPWVAGAVVLSGLRGFYFNYAFQLSENTVYQFWVTIVPAIVNLGLNFWLIIEYGIMGAIYSSVIAFFIALIMSIAIGKKVFPMPMWNKEVPQIILITVVYSLILSFTDSFEGSLFLIFRLFFAGCGTLVLIFLFDTMGFRTAVLRRLKTR